MQFGMKAVACRARQAKKPHSPFNLLVRDKREELSSMPVIQLFSLMADEWTPIIQGKLNPFIRPELERTFKEALDGGTENFVLEVSSERREYVPKPASSKGVVVFLERLRSAKVNL